MASVNSSAPDSSGYVQGRADRATPQAQAGNGGVLHEVGAEGSKLKSVALRAFNKFNNDWSMNLVAMLSYNVLTSFFPLVLAVITILALMPFVSGNAGSIASQINQILPGNVRGQINVEHLISSVSANSGILSVISIAGLLWGGSNLFGAIESTFAIIFRVKTRDFLQQKVMSVVMILLFVVLLPLSLASSFLLSAASTTLSNIIPGALSGPFAIILGLVTGLASLFVLFLAIYMIVPNIPVRWRYAWRGALVAAAVMWIINTIFPFYTAHFVSTTQYGTAALATAIITITWFWFFSLVTVVGAQVNSLVMGVGYWEHDLTRTLMEYEIPVKEGAATATEALRAKESPAVADTPVGLARDAQKVQDPKPGSPTSTQVEATAEHIKARKPVARREDPSKDKNNPKQVVADVGQGGISPLEKAGHRGEKRNSHNDAPHAAYEMPTDLVATGIATGGVAMATPKESFGPPSYRNGAIVIGVVVGLLSTLRTLVRRRAQ